MKTKFFTITEIYHGYRINEYFENDFDYCNGIRISEHSIGAQYTYPTYEAARLEVVNRAQNRIKKAQEEIKDLTENLAGFME